MYLHPVISLLIKMEEEPSFPLHLQSSLIHSDFFSKHFVPLKWKHPLIYPIFKTKHSSYTPPTTTQFLFSLSHTERVVSICYVYFLTFYSLFDLFLSSFCYHYPQKQFHQSQQWTPLSQILACFLLSFLV